MDAFTRHQQEQLAKCQEQIEKSREMISLSLRWLTAYQESVKQELAYLGVYHEEPYDKAVSDALEAPKMMAPPRNR